MKSKLKILCIILIVAILYGMPATAATTDISPEYAADRLYYYGLINGTDNGLELDREINRLESAVSMVRLFGILANRGYSMEDVPEHPFSDVPDWANGYVRLAYLDDIVNGVDKNNFGSNKIISEEQFLTLVLRGLEYEDEYGVYKWDNPWDISIELGLIDSVPPLSGRDFR